ncbi:MAG: NAD(P)-dependent alcohol dehydrogenase [Deltaproteobacteria bacterium]|nr:NAD(P)-dependent alcohol dehydrogenase [Deltaproteobacteria bacterium]
MKAYRLFEWKEPPKFVDIPVPEPGAGQVRLKVAGNGICQSDLHLIHEWEASPPHLKIELPMTIGHEVGGWIDKLGPGVSGFEPDQAAIVTIAGCGHCRYCAAGWNNYCLNKGKQVGMGLDGGLAEYVVAPAGAVVPVNIDPAEAAPLTDAALSSYHAVKRVLPLLTGGTTVAVIGVGGLGHLAVQELKAMSPARIIAYDLSDSALELAKELGADECRRSEDPNFEKMSMEAVLDFVGAGGTIASATRMIKPLGHIAVVGRGPGSFEFTHHALPYGVMLSTSFGGSKSELLELIGLAEAGLLKPHVTRFKLEEAEVALGKLAKGCPRSTRKQ